ncbi:hypothetical protein [Nonomuraea diastatica]|uniref:WXG100 family type VII secretion target n=1 Tax=Nonomuraea diastatica TaxID=1848329 RepID=A0A4R4X499_9ACTN|nr:hypothetical protein [Nonomuraea diastatica]TDD25146.1 hypothetical protein E1294_04050 [Nonomuraea diastatica]
MSVYKEMYMSAAGSAMAASLALRTPWASYMALAIGTMVSDPEGMMDAARQWRTADHSGGTEELDQLDQQLDDLKAQLKDQGTWEGQAFDSFETVHTSFKESLQQLKETRNATGDGVDAQADFFKWGAIACMALAMFMWTVVIVRYWSLITSGPGAVAGKIWETRAGLKGLSITREMLKKHGKAVVGLSLLLFMLKQLTENVGKIFPTLEAIPTQMSSMQSGTSMAFTNDGLTYDKDMGALSPQMDESAEGGMGMPPSAGGGMGIL